MGFLKELLAKQRYPVILLVAGVILLFAANYSVSGELTKPKLTPTKPQLLLSILGILSVLGSTALFLIDEDFVAYRRAVRFRVPRQVSRLYFASRRYVLILVCSKNCTNPPIEPVQSCYPRMNFLMNGVLTTSALQRELSFGSIFRPRIQCFA